MVSAAPLVAPLWRRGRFWVALAVAVAVAAVLLGSLGDAPGRRLDPTSAAPDGALALSRLLRQDGVRVDTTTALPDASRRTVVLAEPDAYSAGQLRELGRRPGRLVLVAPGTAALHAVGLRAGDASPSPAPGCGLPAAVAAGDVTWPSDGAVATAPGGGVRCYDGGVVVDRGTVVLGSAALLTNAHLADRGAAALAINLVSADRTARSVAWVLPGADAGGDGPATLWDLFPGGVSRVFWWLVAVGGFVALWRSRRLGPVVTEPLPVVVRSVELVEGHGRLHLRAGARDVAAARLRAAAARRLARAVGATDVPDPWPLAQAVAPVVHRSPTEVASLLAGPPPATDDDLVRLATDLDRLVADAGDTLTRGTT